MKWTQPTTQFQCPVALAHVVYAPLRTTQVIIVCHRLAAKVLANFISRWRAENSNKALKKPLIMPKVIAVIIYSTEIEIQTLFDSYVLIICNAKQTLFSSEPRQFHAHKLWTCHCHHQPNNQPTKRPIRFITNWNYKKNSSCIKKTPAATKTYQECCFFTSWQIVKNLTKKNCNKIYTASTRARNKYPNRPTEHASKHSLSHSHSQTDGLADQ